MSEPSLLPIKKAIGILEQIPAEQIVDYQGAICSQMSKQEGSVSVVEIKVIFKDGQGPEQSSD
jgi:hypothetical protein